MNFTRLQVTWLKVDKGKFFEYISGRNPPFRNSTIEGAEIDVSIPKLSHKTNSQNEQAQDWMPAGKLVYVKMYVRRSKGVLLYFRHRNIDA